MKFIIFFILVGLVVFLGLEVSGLRKELFFIKEYSRKAEGKNSQLQQDLARLSRVNSENEKFLGELRQSIREFEARLPFSSLEKYIPKPILNDIKPIIEKLETVAEERENTAVFVQ